MNMKSQISFITAALVSIAMLAGCANTGSAVLKTENLFRDEVFYKTDYMPNYDSLVFKSDGAEIYGQLLKPDRSYGEKRPCVLFFHGFAGFARFDDIGQALCRAGCVVLIIHHRGAWGSQGKYSVSNCVQDAVNLVQYVKSVEFRNKYHTDADSVFLVGHSMGGNTVLNAAVRSSGVRGIVMLAPCDIGTTTLKTSKEEMHTFLVENGLEVLKTDGSDALYGDLVRHAAEYAFPNAAGKLQNTALLLITGELDTCISNDMLKTFYETASQNKKLPLCLHKSYKVEHGLMGGRIRITRDIADFILRTCKEGL
ncbi:MAG: alpha/beta fold hydrolase [Lentisphaeria bacterium]|nr:alpha/beta fold hydrolase [Lentisphaeria bacterium]